MFFTSAVVLLIGMARWYYGMSRARAAPPSTAEEATTIAVSRSTSDVAADAVNRRPQGRRRCSRRTTSTPPSGPAGRRRPLWRTSPATADPPSGPRRRDHGTPGRRRPRSSNRLPGIPAGAASPGRPTSRLPPNRGVGHARHQPVSRANRARRTPPADRRAATSVSSVAVAWTTISRVNRTVQQRQRHASPDLAGALSRWRGRRREPHAVPNPAAVPTR